MTTWRPGCMAGSSAHTSPLAQRAALAAGASGACSHPNRLAGERAQAMQKRQVGAVFFHRTAACHDGRRRWRRQPVHAGGGVRDNGRHRARGVGGFRFRVWGLGFRVQAPTSTWQLLGPYRPQTGGQPNCCGLLMPPRWRMVKVSTTNRRVPPGRGATCRAAVCGGDFNHPPPWRHQQAATVWLPTSLRTIWSKQLPGRRWGPAPGGRPHMRQLLCRLSPPAAPPCQAWETDVRTLHSGHPLGWRPMQGGVPAGSMATRMTTHPPTPAHPLTRQHGHTCDYPPTHPPQPPSPPTPPSPVCMDTRAA